MTWGGMNMDYEDMNAFQQQAKRREVMAKFEKVYVDQAHMWDPTFRAIVETLIRGGDPYEIIQRLCEDRMSLVADMKERINHIVQPFNNCPPDAKI